MKILKPGKVEQRKFTCPKCGCVFVADETETYFPRALNGNGRVVVECVCGERIPWVDGKTYEEPTKDEVTRLYDLICNGCVAKPDVAFAIKTDIAFQIARSLLDNGVTFREG